MSDTKKRILVLDDDPDTLAFFSALLEDNGYITDRALDGEAGLAILSRSCPDLITLDMSMPEVSGLKFYRTLKENPDWAGIPVIVISGVSTDMKSFISTRRQVPPPDGYLAKPIDQDELLKMIRNLTGVTKAVT